MNVVTMIESSVQDFDDYDGADGDDVDDGDDERTWKSHLQLEPKELN